MTEHIQEIRAYGYPLKRINLIFGLDQNGKPMALSLIRTEFRELYRFPDRIYALLSKPDSDEITILEYISDRFLALEYTEAAFPSETSKDEKQLVLPGIDVA